MSTLSYTGTLRFRNVGKADDRVYFGRVSAASLTITHADGSVTNVGPNADGTDVSRGVNEPIAEEFSQLFATLHGKDRNAALAVARMIAAKSITLATDWPKPGRQASGGMGGADAEAVAAALLAESESESESES